MKKGRLIEKIQDKNNADVSHMYLEIMDYMLLERCTSVDLRRVYYPGSDTSIQEKLLANETLLKKLSTRLNENDWELVERVVGGGSSQSRHELGNSITVLVVK